MPIHLKGAGPGQDWDFKADPDRIAIGRDPAQCQVVLDDPHVGRVHCTLVRRLHQYLVELTDGHAVQINGRDAYPKQPLPSKCDLRIGHEGPTLHVDTAGGLQDTLHTLGRTLNTALGNVQRLGLTKGLQQLARDARRSREAAFIALSGVVVLSGILGLGGYFVWRLWPRTIEDAENDVRPTLMHIAFISVDENGKLQPPVGAPETGFLISKANRLVATTARVADHRGSVVALYAVPEGKSISEGYEVDRVYYHPALLRRNAFGVESRAEAGKDDQYGPGDGEVEPFTRDVAVLRLKKDKELPDDVREVQWASPQEIENLLHQSIGVSGYASEQTNSGNSPNEVRNLAGLVNDSADPNSSGQLAQRVEYSRRMDLDLNGAPVFNLSGHVVAINSSRTASGTNSPESYGIRIDCLLEVLKHHQLDTLVKLPSGWDLGQIQKHLDQLAQAPKPDQDKWAAIDALRKVGLIASMKVPGQDCVESSSADKLKACNEAIEKANKFSLARIPLAAVYWEQPGGKLQSESFQKAKGEFTAARDNDPQCFEASLRLCTLEKLESGNQTNLNSLLQEVELILKAPLSPRIKALAWRTEADIWGDKAEAETALHNADEALPQSADNYKLEALYWKHVIAQYGATADASKKSNKADAALTTITAAIKSAGNAACQAQQFRNNKAQNSQTVEIGKIEKDAQDACEKTQWKSWTCIDCYVHVLEIAGKYDEAKQAAVRALKCAPDAAYTEHSKGDVCNCYRSLETPNQLVQDAAGAAGLCLPRLGMLSSLEREVGTDFSWTEPVYFLFKP